MECKACGKWFGSLLKADLCPTCERAYNRIFSGIEYDRLRELAQADREGQCVVLAIPPKSRAWVCKKYCSTPHEAYFPTASAILADMESGYVFGKTREEAEAALEAKKGEQDD